MGYVVNKMDFFDVCDENGIPTGETICPKSRDPEKCVPVGGLRILSRFLYHEKGQKNSEPQRLVVLNNRIAADHVVEILKANGIPAFIKEYGLGSLYGAYFSVFGESGVHIYVPEQVYAEAKKILEDMSIQTD